MSLPRRLTDGALAAAAAVPAGTLAGTASAVALAVGASEAYLAAGAAGSPTQRSRSPMRRRILNLTEQAADLLPGSPAAAVAATGAKSPQVLSGLRELRAANTTLPRGLHSQLRASSPTPP